MPKIFLVLFGFYAAISFAGPIAVGPIDVTGSGYFGESWEGSSIGFSVSGSNGTDNIAFTVNDGSFYGFPYGPNTTELSGTGLTSINSFAAIDGIESAAFSFTVGAGGGSLDIYNPTYSTLLASATLVGWVIAADCSGGPADDYAQGDILVSSAPEPSTLFLAGLGIFGLVCLKHRADAICRSSCPRTLR